MAPASKEPDATKPQAQPESGDKSKKQLKAGKDGKVEEEELSEEDAQLKSELEMLVERLSEPKESLYQPSLNELKRFIKESTSSMTAVPKPLKFLRPHYPQLTKLHSAWTDLQLKSSLADVLSVLGMTYSSDDPSGLYKRECLKYRMLSNVDEGIAGWGHEYLRHLALEIGEEYDEFLDDGKPTDQNGKLLKLALEIVPYFLKHNAEAEAVDLLLEIEAIDKLPQFVDKDTFGRVCLYMVGCVPLLAPPDDLAFLHTAFSIYLSNDQLTQALALAIRLDDESLIKSVFEATTDTHIHQQLGFILGRQNSCFKWEDPTVQECISNVRISEFFNYLVKELNLLQPKLPEDIYKSHLENSTLAAPRLESAKQNLASAFVNAFANAGYRNEKLVNDEHWVSKTKGEGRLSTAASLGLVHLWDNDGLQQLDKFLYTEQVDVTAGALLGMGVSSTSVHDEVDAALLMLRDYITGESPQPSKVVAAAITGLGIAFAGSENEEALSLLLPLVTDQEHSLEINSLAALALGHIFVGTCNGDITSTILQTLLERDFSDLGSKWVRFMSLGLGLLYMGKYEQVEDVLDTIDAIEHPIAKTLKVVVGICSYSGTGNVLQIQALLQMCTAKPKDEDEEKDDGDDNAADEDTVEAEIKTEDKEKAENSESDSNKESTPEDESFQGYAVLGLALIAMGEEIGQDMSLRHFGHLMHYGNPLIRRAVPLAMGLVSAANPQMKVFDTLSRYSHDSDLDVAYNAIFSMGIVGAGTNNARLAQLLRQLASYYVNDPDAMFMVRIAQGLIHLGKGTLTVTPFNSDRQILSKVSLASLLTVAVTLLDPGAFILDQHSALLYYLTPAIHPRMLVTVDEDLNPIKVNVRVGQAVDVVGQAGKPKTITGWVTHSTPVLLGHGERAELENDEYLSLASSLEGVVILKKNPDWMDVDA
ncbi:unnamed protein product [Kuraishia capsulata CBS 1993]|uniref:26S proteasome regulatory subunit RPN1 n=1 Tax=Kuraishia capsulata CBS 1993 TaxID=1382522 RepID=W6MKR8_9ASCO|nr:uncharacterized protein KUCA_T00002601001 [Kuraishia capsulata CBS 1993]CDK26628.1 unnamed protein product [Kuraishia capsulata CBS 1993]